MSKKRLIKDFDKLPKEIQDRIRKEFPTGFAHKLINFTGPKGERISALPFETEDIYYLVRWSIQEFKAGPKDDDFDETFGTRDDIGFEDAEMQTPAEDEDDSFGDDDYGMAGGNGSEDRGESDEDY